MLCLTDVDLKSRKMSISSHGINRMSISAADSSRYYIYIAVVMLSNTLRIWHQFASDTQNAMNEQSD